MIGLVGQARFDGFKAGTAAPTDTEKQQLSQCFAVTTAPAPAPTAPAPGGTAPKPPTASTPIIPDDKSTCIVSVIGQAKFDALKSQAASLLPDDGRKIAETCFKGQGPSNSTVTVAQPSSFQSDSPAILCMSKVLGEARFKEINSTKTQPTGDEKQKIGTACFGQRPPTGGIVTVNSVPISPALEICMKAAVGEERFKAIATSASAPTPAEKAQGEACFKSTGQAPVVTPPSGAIDDKTRQCVKLAIGEDRFQAMTSGGQPTLEEHNKIEACFGANPHPMAPAPKVAMSSDMVTCLKVAVGEDRFNAISSGTPPTEAEKQAGFACFKNDRSKITDDASKKLSAAVPVAPAVIQYLPTDTNKVQAKPQVSGDKISVSGKAPAGSIVDVYFYSDPVVKSAQADASGNWTYTLDDKLIDGDHTVLAAVHTDSGDVVRSVEAKFLVGSTATSNDTAAIATFSITVGQAIIGLVALAAIAAGAYFLIRRRKATAAPPPTPPSTSA